MLPRISEIKRKRKLLGLTQKELAERADVSQSLIAKIESGTINASYQLVAQIFEALAAIENRISKTAKEIMTKKVLTVKPDEKLVDATKKMKDKAISQMPVINSTGICIGSISDNIILKIVSQSFEDQDDFEFVAQKTVKNYMGEPFPVIAANTPVQVISNLLNYAPAILVSEKGKLIGIITREDLFKVLEK
jgi:predicted transcriptional regulator